MKRVSDQYASASKSRIQITEFRGVDLSNSPTNVSINRSPDAPNMIRDVPGKVRKRMGFHKIAEYDGRINGVYSFVQNQTQTELVHAADKLYINGEQVRADLADERSTGWQLGGVFYLFDGKAMIAYDGKEVWTAKDKAYVPSYIIARKPSGGGTVYEALNLIGDRWSESFLSDGKSVVYQLCFDELDSSFIRVEQMKEADVWSELELTKDYTFDAGLGRVTFLSAPVVSPVDGADNIRITVSKQRDEYAQRINKCNLSVLYGIAGAADRLFVSGNPDFPNYDWYSGMNDGSYFPQTSYSVLGLSSPISGYSIVADKLAAHKKGDADGRNIILREGKMTEGKASFPVVNSLQGAGIASGHTVAYLKTEPLFFSQSGIYAITPDDTNGERYSQNRSFFINSVLEGLENKADCDAASYRDFYLLANGGKLYVLDSLMKSYEEGAPYSTHQYEAYVLEGIDARRIWTAGERLRFGTSDGKIMEFYTDSRDPDSYNDDGSAINAHWDTPMISTEAFYMQKSFRYMAVKLLAAAATGLKAYVQTRGIWRELFEESASFRYLDFSSIDFSKLTFSGDMTPKTFGRKIRVNKVDKARFRMENNKLREPFGLYNLALEFTENGKIK